MELTHDTNQSITAINMINSDVSPIKEKVGNHIVQTARVKSMMDNIKSSDQELSIRNHEREIKQLRDEMKRLSDQVEYAMRMAAELNKVTHDNRARLENLQQVATTTTTTSHNHSNTNSTTNIDVDALSKAVSKSLEGKFESMDSIIEELEVVTAKAIPENATYIDHVEDVTVSCLSSTIQRPSNTPMVTINKQECYQ